MKNKLDFIIDEDSQIYRTIFRIYPKSTTIHSFDENPPKTWKEVYKVYYSFAIIIQYYIFRCKVSIFDIPVHLYKLHSFWCMHS